MTTRPKPTFHREKKKKINFTRNQKRKNIMIENLEYKELNLPNIMNNENRGLKLRPDPINDFETETEGRK